MTTRHARRSEADRGLVLRAVSLLRRLSSATNEWQRTELTEGFTVNQALVLHHLVSHGDATPSDLAEWLRVSRGGVTPTIKRLEDLGLVSRRIDEEDGRKQWLSATQEAREISHEVDKKVLRPIFSTFEEWSPADLRRFCEDLDRVLSSPLFEVRS